MGKIVKQGIEFSGSSNSADSIVYNETTNVKQVIDEINENLAKSLHGNGNIFELGLADIATASIGYYSTGKNSDSTYNISSYAYLFKPIGTSFNGAFYVRYTTGSDSDGMFVYRGSTGKFERLVPTSKLETLQSRFQADTNLRNIDVLDYFINTAPIGVSTQLIYLPVNGYNTEQSWFTFYKLTNNYGRIEQRPVNSSETYTKALNNGAWGEWAQ